MQHLLPSERAAACECADVACECGGYCKDTAKLVRLYRIDMTDYSGTNLCPDCAADAMDSGCFGDAPSGD